jgi:glycosyltransferase family protein
MKKILLAVWNFLFDTKKNLVNGFFYLCDFFYRHLFSPPKVMTNLETIDYIINNRCSVSRYGDGELKLICGKMTAYESPSAGLTEDLKNALTDNRKMFLPCIPSFFSSLDGLTAQAASYWKWHLSRYRRAWYKNTDKKIIYGNAFISRFYIDYEDKNYAGVLFNKIKKIWDGREIILIEGGKSRLGFGNDLFAGAGSVRRILVPDSFAYTATPAILAKALEYSTKDTLFILAAGPAATVLAHKLFLSGCQALDLGHIDVQYEWYLRGAANKTPVANKMVFEAIGGTEVGELDDKEYLSQIIAKVT